MLEDAELLRRYAQDHAEDAFAELVRRHVDFVYGVAVRRVGGDSHLAEDICQDVFVALARKAASLSRRPLLRRPTGSHRVAPPGPRANRPFHG